MRRRQGAYVGMNFGSHKALVAMAEPHQHHLARAQLGYAEAAQRFHVDEDVLGALAPGQEAEPLGTVEPFYQHALQSARGRDLYVGLDRRHLRGMHGRRLVHGKNAEGLITAVAFLDDRDDARAFQNRLIAIPAQAGDVQQHILHAVVGYDEAKALGDVEPFYDTGDLDQIDGVIALVITARRDFL